MQNFDDPTNTSYIGMANPYQDQSMQEILRRMQILQELGLNNQQSGRDAVIGNMPSPGVAAAMDYNIGQLKTPKNEGGPLYYGQYPNYQNMIEVRGAQNPTQEDAVRYAEYLAANRQPQDFGQQFNTGIGNNIQGLLRLLGLSQ